MKKRNFSAVVDYFGLFLLQGKSVMNYVVDFMFVVRLCNFLVYLVYPIFESPIAPYEVFFCHI